MSSIIKEPNLKMVAAGSGSGAVAHGYLPSFPIAWSDRFLEVAHRDQIALGVQPDRKLGERPGCRAEDDHATAGEVEGRLVTRAQELVGLVLPEADRTAHVGADLRVAEDAVEAPVRL